MHSDGSALFSFAGAERGSIFSSLVLANSNWFPRVLLYIPDCTSQFATQENAFFSLLSSFGGFCLSG